MPNGEADAQTAAPPRDAQSQAQAQVQPLRNYSVLLGLATVGSVLFVRSVGARLASELGALRSPVGAASH